MRKVVMFSQTFCQPCKQLEPVLKGVCDSLNLPLEKWNVEEDWDLAIKYDVKSTPTVFVMDEDNRVLSAVAARTAVPLMKELS